MRFRLRKEVVVTEGVTVSISRLESLTDRLQETAEALESLVQRLKDEEEEEGLPNGRRSGDPKT